MTEHPTLEAALVAALAELTVVGKDRTVDTGSYSYSYADLGSIVALTRPVLAEHGMVALTPLHDHGDGLACTVKIVHAGGQSMDLGPFPFPRGRDAQATGSMATYHRRYALVAALGMATGEDDDGASAVAAEPAPPVETDGPVSAANAAKLVDKVTAAGLDVAEVVRLGTNGRTESAAEVLRSEVRAVKEAIDNLTPAPQGGTP